MEDPDGKTHRFATPAKNPSISKAVATLIFDVATLVARFVLGGVLPDALDHRRHRGARHLLLVGGPRVALHLFQRLVPADRGDHVGRASGFGQAAAGGLAQAVRGAVLRQPGGIALLLEPIPEAIAGERLPVRGGEKREVLARRRVEDDLSAGWIG